MLKKILSFFIIFFLSIISLYLTNITIDYIKELDPIMTEIKDNSSFYQLDAVDALIEDNTIIPGLSGLIVDTSTSYSLMKKYGSYNDNLLVLENTTPTISISNIYDKYITSGNSTKKEVALIFKIEKTNYLEEIISILNSKEVVGTFFIEGNELINSPDVIKLLYLNNQKIEFIGDNSIELDKVNILLKSYINKSLSFCYSDNFNQAILLMCSNKKIHTVVPSINTDKYPYNDIKNQLSNGSIIKINNNSRSVYELSYIINYIKQKGYKIVSLEKLLEE